MSIQTRNFGDDAPSGPNLEYDPLFTALTIASQPEEERQAGSEILPGAEPDAKKIIECAEAIFAESNDMRAAVHYAYAAVRQRGFSGLADATGYIRACLEDFWDSAHPQLDADDDDDPTMRINSLLGLVDPATVLRSARMAPLTNSPAFGRFSLRDLAIASGETSVPEGMDNPPTSQTVSAGFQDSAREDLEQISAAIRQSADDLKAINAVFDAQLPGQGPSLDALSSLLKKADSALAPFVAVSEEAAVDEAPPAAEGGAPAPAAPALAAPPGTISSREDVEKALDRIMDYYAKHEPSSPLPILLRRARRLIGADFMTILQDIAPQGMENAQLISGGDENTT